jgi:hypothetical protein
MAAVQDISESLDVLAQLVGDVLVRAADRWRAAGPATPAIGHVLTYQGVATPPIWALAGAGVSQLDLPSTPIIPDGTKNFYDLDVSSYSAVDLALDNIGFAAADQTIIEYSVDGGVSFRTGAADYWWSNMHSTGEGSATAARLLFSRGAATTAHNCFGSIAGLRATRATYSAQNSVGSGAVSHAAGRPNFDGPVTDIRITSSAGSNFNAGTIYATGQLAS